MSGYSAFQIGLGIFNGIAAINVHSERPIGALVLSFISAFGIGMSLWGTSK